MNRFEYEEDDLSIGESQCNLCIHFISKTCKCNLIGAIPDEILSDDVTCQHFEYEEDNLDI